MLYEAALKIRDAGHELVLIATAPASPESTIVPSDFEELARQCGCPFIFAGRFRPDHVDVLRGARADVAITMNWPTMIRHDVTGCFPMGIVNAHGSDLPKFRGNACPNWAILAGEPRIGLSFHFIDPDGLDTGDVVHRDFIANTPDLYIGDVYDWLRHAVPSGFLKALEAVAAPGFVPQKQAEADATRAYPRRAEDGKLDFGSGSEQLLRLVRASSRPFAGSYCFYEKDTLVRVWRATLIELEIRSFAVPGQILFFEGEAPVVMCGDGRALRFDDVSFPDGFELKKSVRARFF
jgi:UDP-4-amino-4-deoxy-L-arabinose formyltransferase/UDP-glucuronic acid dehydrogenase (UDP-4-keto-hexauronic acid decarboxylating)